MSRRLAAGRAPRRVVGGLTFGSARAASPRAARRGRPSLRKEPFFPILARHQGRAPGACSRRQAGNKFPSDRFKVGLSRVAAGSRQDEHGCVLVMPTSEARGRRFSRALPATARTLTLQRAHVRRERRYSVHWAVERCRLASSYRRATSSLQCMYYCEGERPGYDLFRTAGRVVNTMAKRGVRSAEPAGVT